METCHVDTAEQCWSIAKHMRSADIESPTVDWRIMSPAPKQRCRFKHLCVRPERRLLLIARKHGPLPRRSDRRSRLDHRRQQRHRPGAGPRPLRATGYTGRRDRALTSTPNECSLELGGEAKASGLAGRIVPFPGRRGWMARERPWAADESRSPTIEGRAAAPFYRRLPSSTPATSSDARKTPLSQTIELFVTWTVVRGQPCSAWSTGWRRRARHDGMMDAKPLADRDHRFGRRASPTAVGSPAYGTVRRRPSTIWPQPLKYELDKMNIRIQVMQSRLRRHAADRETNGFRMPFADARPIAPPRACPPLQALLAHGGFETSFRIRCHPVPSAADDRILPVPGILRAAAPAFLVNRRPGWKAQAARLHRKILRSLPSAIGRSRSRHR